MMFSLLFTATILGRVIGHGHVALPVSTRHGGSVEGGGDCSKGQCFWFSNNVDIPGEPTLPNKYRSLQLNVSSGVEDVYHTNPWRAPGTAPVFGSGCGVAGGSDTPYMNGGYPTDGSPQGMDGLKLPQHGIPPTWTRGSNVEVAWAISANHGGGYSWRLCKNDGNVTEECFQKTQLKFHGDSSWVIYADGSRVEFPIAKTTVGTYPAGSEWARDPVPGCYYCDAYTECGAPLPPVPGYVQSPWDQQVNCYARCDGANNPGKCQVPLQFPEQSPGISGFGKSVWDWSILDLVEIPTDIPTGEYLLGWRWDCEESNQVWENCADIIIK